MENILKLAKFSMDNSPIETYWIRSDASFFYVNKIVCSSLGYSQDEMLNMTVLDITPDLTPERWKEQWNEIKENSHKSFLSSHIRKDKTIYPVEIMAKYIQYEDKEFILTYVVDISERERLEKDLKNHKQNLEKLVEEKTQLLMGSLRELECINIQLKEAHYHKNRFLSTMSHELRTPLNSILGFSQALEMQYFGKLNSKQMDYVCMIHTSGQLLLNIINDILDIARIDSGSMEISLEEISPYGTIEDVISIMSTQFSEKSIDLRFKPALGMNFILADSKKFKQVLLNLLTNALKYTPSGGRVEVQAREYNGKIKIMVVDTGVGIKEEDLDKIFEEFYQSEETKNQALGGTGIGLALCKRLVMMQNGEIGVSSTPGKGSTFWFTLPMKSG